MFHSETHLSLEQFLCFLKLAVFQTFRSCNFGKSQRQPATMVAILFDLQTFYNKINHALLRFASQASSALLPDFAEYPALNWNPGKLSFRDRPCLPGAGCQRCALLRWSH